MLHKNVIATLIAASALSAGPVFAQESPKMDVAVQAFGSFVKTTTNDGVQQSSSNSGGVLASYRYFFTNSMGVEINYGYNRSTQSYNYLQNPFGVKADQDEFTAEYVYRRPFHRFTPFVDAGVGALLFNPTDSAFASLQARAAFVYGAGADYKLTSHLFVRAEYRGLIYNSPTFGVNYAAGADRYTHRAEPSVGFGYSF